MISLICYNHPKSKTTPKGDKYWRNKNKSLNIRHDVFSKKFLILYGVIPFLMFSVIPSYGETISTLEQAKQGVPASEVDCKEGLVLMVRESGNPACLTPPSYLRSIDRGWGVGDLDLLQVHPEQLAQMRTNDNLMGKLFK